MRLTSRRVAALLVALLVIGATPALGQEGTVRYYISQILPPDVNKDYYRLALAEAGSISHAALIPTDPIIGIPLFSWGIAYAKAADWSQVDADPRNFRLFQGEELDQPDLFSLLTRLDTARWGDLPLAKKTAIKDKLVALGVPTKDIGGTVSLRAILQKAGQHLQPGFDETRLYVR